MEVFRDVDVEQIKIEIMQAFNAISKKHDVTLSMGVITYTPYNFTAKLTAKTGNGEDFDRLNFNRNCNRLGFDESDFGKEFYHAGAMYKITGINTRASKMPMSYENTITGQKYKASPTWLKRVLNIANRNQE